MEEIIPLFERKRSYVDAFPCPERKEGMILPMVSDAMFNVMFNNEKRKRYVSFILAEILYKDINYIEDNIEFVKNTLDKDIVNEYGKRVDLIVKLDNIFYNVEMNNNSSIDQLKRNIDYAHRNHDANNRIDDRYTYRDTIQIDFNNFTFEGLDRVISKFVYKNEDDIPLTRELQIYYVSLPLIRKKYYNKEELTEFEKFILVCNELDIDIAKEIAKESEIMNEYLSDAKEASNDADLHWVYDKELDDIRNRNALIDEAVAEAVAEAKEETRIEAFEQGVEQRNIEIVSKMLSKNISINDIAELTGLTINEIKKIQANL